MRFLFAALCALLLLASVTVTTPVVVAQKTMLTPYLTLTPYPDKATASATSARFSPTPIPTRTPTATDVQRATPTPIPSLTPTSLPTVTQTPIPQPSQLPTPVPGAPCPFWVHELYTTIGPDGWPYPTWHPQIDPATGCYFTHEHGDDPRTSLANSTLPAFGFYDNRTEPHVGFKVIVANRGEVNTEGSAVLDSHRLVFHMGTGGTGRFDTRFHSAQIDVVGSVTIHEGGMADTGSVGSLCNDPGSPGRRVMVAYGCHTDSPYEIWGARLTTQSGDTLNFLFAVRDPITVMDPANHSLLELSGLGNGCMVDFYLGPWFTPQSDFGPSTHGLGYIATYQAGDPNRPQSQFAASRNHCSPGLGLSN